MTVRKGLHTNPAQCCKIYKPSKILTKIVAFFRCFRFEILKNQLGIKRKQKITDRVIFMFSIRFARVSDNGSRRMYDVCKMEKT